MNILSSLDGELTPQGRAVVRAFTDARTRAATFLLSCGVFPEVSESGSERFHRIVRDLAARHLDQKGLDRALRLSLQRGARSPESRDEIEAALTAILASEAKAAYVFGLAAGLSLASASDWLKA